MIYHIQPAQGIPAPEPNWRDPVWAEAETADVAHFRPESSAHHPRTLVRLAYDAANLHGIFQAQDQFVRCARTGYFAEVWKDSCVEFFAEPKPGGGYFNFEFNCGGSFLCCHILDPERAPGGFKKFTRVPAEIGRGIQARSSLPERVEPEISEPMTWTLRFSIPLSLFERYVGPLGGLKGGEWRGNFFKCAEDNSHPHWASWAPVDEFNFHRPGCFGVLRFG